jgi:hypothetical protein
VVIWARQLAGELGYDLTVASCVVLPAILDVSRLILYLSIVPIRFCLAMLSAAAEQHTSTRDGAHRIP